MKGWRRNLTAMTNRLKLIYLVNWHQKFQHARIFLQVAFKRGFLARYSVRASFLYKGVMQTRIYEGAVWIQCILRYHQVNQTTLLLIGYSAWRVAMWGWFLVLTDIDRRFTRVWIIVWTVRFLGYYGNFLNHVLIGSAQRHLDEDKLFLLSLTDTCCLNLLKVLPWIKIVHLLLWAQAIFLFLHHFILFLLLMKASTAWWSCR